MKGTKRKKSGTWKKCLLLICCLLLGVGWGICLDGHIDRLLDAGTEGSELVLRVAWLLFGLYFSIFLQVLLHEAGHLLFGLLTGYGFSSYRIGSFMWMKEEGKLRFCRLSIVGTGGQCLMTPPDMENGKMPYVLYNLGGPLMNLVTAVLFAGLSYLCRSAEWVSYLFAGCGLVGFTLALINGIPMRLENVDNDGYNAWSMGKNPEALRAFWIQMKVNEQITKGIRLKEMPKEWFELPSAESMKNSMVAAVGVFACNRMMDAMDFERADQTMQELMEMDTGMVGLHRSLLAADRMYCEAVGKNRSEVLERMMDKPMRKFMKLMKKYPSVLRTQYAYALLAKGDAEQAGRIKEMFEKAAGSYPHPSEIESERALMEYARKRSL